MPLASVVGMEGSAIEQPKLELRLGKEVISKVRAAYERGEYKEFLSQMDAAYRNGDLSGLIAMRQKEIPADFQEQWEQQFSELQRERNRELLNTLSDRDDSKFAEKIRSLAANISTPQQERAMAKLNSFIAMAPQTGANGDENTLIDLDLEYEYKLLNAKLPYENINPLQSEEYALALRMEKMDKMVEASKNFQDHTLKQAVGLAAANFDVRLARNLDGTDLNQLLKAKARPTNEVEEKVYSILSFYQGQFADLMKVIDQHNG